MPLLLLPLTLPSAGREEAAAVPLVLLIGAVSRSGLLLPSRPRKVVS